MKKLLVAALLILGFNAGAQVYKAKKDACSIDFLSKSPLEDIEAINKTPIIAYKPETGDIQFAVVMTQFKFKSALMEEHFNENYVESEKFPQAIFKGKVNEKIDLSKEGENKVTVTGKMVLHGVTKDITVDGTISKKGEELVIGSAFKIKVADYNIKVPSLYVKNIAEVVDVTVKGVLEPMAKK
jgi:polyisoprenoid-binding protein YceI